MLQLYPINKSAVVLLTGLISPRSYPRLWSEREGLYSRTGGAIRAMGEDGL